MISQSGLNHPFPVLSIKLVELLLFFKFELELLIVGLHIESWMLCIECLYFQQPLISLAGCFTKKSDRLMKSSQFQLDFIVTQINLLAFFFIDFDLFPPYIVLVEILQLFDLFLLILELLFALLHLLQLEFLVLLLYHLLLLNHFG